GPFRGRGFSFTQRWHYLHGVLNWLCKPFMVLLLIAPSLYWFGGLPAFEADYLSFLRYGVPALLGQIVYMGWISRSRTLPLFMEATHAVTCLAARIGCEPAKTPGSPATMTLFAAASPRCRSPPPSCSAPPTRRAIGSLGDLACIWTAWGGSTFR